MGLRRRGYRPCLCLVRPAVDRPVERARDRRVRGLRRRDRRPRTDWLPGSVARRPRDPRGARVRRRPGAQRTTRRRRVTLNWVPTYVVRIGRLGRYAGGVPTPTVPGDGENRPSLEAGRQGQTRREAGTQSHGTRAIGDRRRGESAGLPKSGGWCGHGPPAPRRARARRSRHVARLGGCRDGPSHLNRVGSGPPSKSRRPLVTDLGASRHSQAQRRLGCLQNGHHHLPVLRRGEPGALPLVRDLRHRAGDSGGGGGRDHRGVPVLRRGEPGALPHVRDLRYPASAGGCRRRRRRRAQIGTERPGHSGPGRSRSGRAGPGDPQGRDHHLHRPQGQHGPRRARQFGGRQRGEGTVFRDRHRPRSSVTAAGSRSTSATRSWRSSASRGPARTTRCAPSARPTAWSARSNG